VKTRRRLILLVLLAVALALPACNRGFQQAEVAPGDIPAELREAAARFLPDPVIWRAFYEQEGYDIAVAYHTGSMGRFRQWLWRVFHEGQLIHIDHNIQAGLLLTERYAWRASEEVDHGSTGAGPNSIAAYGWAWDHAAHRVVGTTAQGRTFEGRVVNGYWLLLDCDVRGIDRFETVVVEDAEGKVLHSYDRTVMMP